MRHGFDTLFKSMDYWVGLSVREEKLMEYEKQPNAMPCPSAPIHIRYAINSPYIRIIFLFVSAHEGRVAQRDQRSGPGAVAVSRGVTHLEYGGLSRMVPARLPRVTRALLGCFVGNVCQRKYGEADKARQQRIVWSVLRGSCEGKPKTIA